MGDLFTYRIRMMYGRWYIIYDGNYNECSNYADAKREAYRLERQGYIDGDKEVA